MAMTRYLMLLIALVLVGAGALIAFRHPAPPPRFSTIPISTGTVLETVTATGTIAATRTVDIGTQVTGQITHLHADFNSVVHVGEVIAELDTAPFVSQLKSAEAEAEKARIDRDGHEAALQVDDRDRQRMETLLTEGLASPQDAEQARAVADLDRTQLKDDDAQIVTADSSVEQAKLNLAHCTITSPIDGVVVERDVDEGQTVTSSTSAPRLFLIATDLHDLRVMGNIDEAEVSKLRPGQTAVFTVTSYPGLTFRATVAEVRLNATVSSDVVIYQAVFQVANPDLRLRPGMTAALKVKTGEADGVLRVPNAAIKFRPTRELFDALHEPFPEVVRVAGAMEGIDDPTAAGRESASGSLEADSRNPQARPAGSIVDGLFAPRPRVSTPGQVWILESGQLKRVPVLLGVTDGAWTQLASGNLTAGEPVVTGIALTTVNPGFMVR